MFQSHAHRIAGHAAAAASPNTPAHLRVHQQRLANMSTTKPKGMSPKNMLMSQPPAETISGNAMRGQVMAMQQQKGMMPSAGVAATPKKSRKRPPVFSSPIYG